MPEMELPIGPQHPAPQDPANFRVIADGGGGVAALGGVEAPRRAQWIRTLVAELERIHSHLLWLGVAAHEIGYNTLFMYTWRDRETVQDILEVISGNRVNYGMNAIGGVRRGVTDARKS